MQTSRLLLAIALAVAPVLSAAAAVTIGVDKAELITDLVAGQKRVLTLQVTNSGTDPMPVTVYPEDWQIVNGEPNFNNAPHARALGHAVTVAPASFELAPGAAQTVTVVLDPGAGPFTAGTYWSVVFVQSSRLAPEAAGTGGRGAQMRVVERIAVPLFADSTPESHPLPADVSVTSITRTPGGLDVGIANPSAYVRFVSGATVNLTPLSGGDICKVPLHAFRLLPGSTREVPVGLPAAVAGLGRTSVLAVVDYGAQDLVVGEARLTF